MDYAMIDPLLGTMTDKEVASKTGVSLGKITLRRMSLGIGAYKHGINWRDIDPYLGKLSDEKVGKMFGVSATGILLHRRKMAVTPYKEANKKEYDTVLM